MGGEEPKDREGGDGSLIQIWRAKTGREWRRQIMLGLVSAVTPSDPYPDVSGHSLISWENRLECVARGRVVKDLGRIWSGPGKPEPGKGGKWLSPCGAPLLGFLG